MMEKKNKKKFTMKVIALRKKQTARGPRIKDSDRTFHNPSLDFYYYYYYYCYDFFIGFIYYYYYYCR